jgi:hypothetical protein
VVYEGHSFVSDRRRHPPHFLTDVYNSKVNESHVMHLGIVVVYLLNEKDGPLLELHLRQIAQCTDVPYTIYASVNRLLPEFRSILEGRPEVVICPFEDTGEPGGWEHSYYFTGLVNRALEDDVTHIVSLHPDSFPIRPGWVQELTAKLDNGAAIVAVVNREEGETIRPWTACLIVPRNFYDRYGPILSLSELRDHPTPEYEAYVEAAGSWHDASDAYGWILHSRQLPWHRLYRSNKVNDHYLCGGIYDDVIFHLGGAVQKGSSYITPPSLQTARHLKAIVPPRLRELASNWLSRRRVQASASAFDVIRGRLLNNPQQYFDYLRGIVKTPPSIAES